VKIQARTLALAVALIALPATTFAQSTYTQRHDINNRRGNEQSRIQQGKASGQLTHAESHRLEARQHSIHTEEKGMRAADNGHLTAADRHTLAQRQNNQSRDIYNDKHNGATKPGVAPR
jgi:hypothetical protein